MLPFRPLPLSLLRERVAPALAVLYSRRDIASGRAKPWDCADNLLDFESGLRLIVTRELFDGEGPPVIHVAAAVPQRHTLLDDLFVGFRWSGRTKSYDTPAAHLMRVVPGQWSELSPVRLEFLGYSNNDTVPHFFGELEDGLERAEPRVLAKRRRAV